MADTRMEVAGGSLVVSCDMTPVVCQLVRDLKGSLPLALIPGRGLCGPCCDRVCGPPGWPGGPLVGGPAGAWGCWGPACLLLPPARPCHHTRPSLCLLLFPSVGGDAPGAVGAGHSERVWGPTPSFWASWWSSPEQGAGPGQLHAGPAPGLGAPSFLPLAVLGGVAVRPSHKETEAPGGRVAGE